MKLVIDIPEDVWEMLKDKLLNEFYINSVLGQVAEGTPLKEEIIELLDKTYNDFLNSDCGDSYCIIDGETYRSDMGYALEGMRMIIEVLKKRLENKE